MNKQSQDETAGLQLWGGYECTVNRVGDMWFDQTLRSGHEHRLDDLAMFAELGIRSLRYPALWERMSPGEPYRPDFGWTDERLAELRRLGVNPILTLCHHGSGPGHTSLVQDSFAAGLATHAAAVAQRYPWVDDWTPVNEPLTTARFSALYGYWYPHTRDEKTFWVALLNEIDATRLSMREIRKVNPRARLVQTDDLGFCHATPPLQCEADFQNERRWMGWDLLCGMVVPGHALWRRLAGFGLEARLRAIADDPCPPDVIGINHYLSSERLLDDRVHLHPHRAVADRELGTCAGVPYVDVDAARNLGTRVVGLAGLVEQAWQRYGRPIAITECHNGSTRENQARWFLDVWDSANRLRSQGVEVVAVTAWALLGSFDWNRMVTRWAGHYEPGVFDVRSGQPRPTLMARVLRDLAHGRVPSAPGLHVPGWWKQAAQAPVVVPGQRPAYELATDECGSTAHRPLMIVAGDGALARLAVRACELRELHYVLVHRDLEAAIKQLRPWAVLDARDRHHVCVQQGDDRRSTAPPVFTLPGLGRACSRLGLPCAVFSSAHALRSVTFDGPHGSVLVVRTGRVYEPTNIHARPVQLLRALEAGEQVQASATSPWDYVYGPDLMDGVLDLLLDGVSGEVDFVPGENWSEAEFASVLAAVADCDPTLIATTAQAGAGAGAAALGDGPEFTYLSPAETAAERFVRDHRFVCHVAGARHEDQAPRDAAR
ncbi:MAG: putative b-glycosidase, Glycoside Hydrolase Family 1 [Ramlibacter sp.]|jgi:dTDP-4-dehydrorhamnose reductase|nr:putative b-glycosidase, Glycoside Hydrolase Family 1 [Ramlibacter sp.]